VDGRMTVYVIAGKLGSGKTLAALDKIREHMRKGHKIATNINLNVDKLVGYRNTVNVQRLPDHPTADSLMAIGLGSDSLDESTHGLLVLDECATWLNARSWSAEGRQRLIEWMLHARKYRWHVILVVQHYSLLDKQIRDSVLEMYGVCRRLDRAKLPLIPIRLPKVHVCIVRYGTLPTAMVAEKWWYRSTDLYDCYDTGQVFTAVNTAPYSMLSHYQLAGRYRKKGMTPVQVLLFPVKLAVFAVLVAFQPKLLAGIRQNHSVAA
jgi:hypothetical protein